MDGTEIRLGSNTFTFVTELSSVDASANDAEQRIPVDEVPPPPRVESGEVLEPEVTIVRTESATRYEYRVGGRLLGIRVEPKNGIPYLLVDADGDGKLEHRTNNPYGPNFLINSWVLFSW